VETEVDMYVRMQQMGWDDIGLSTNPDIRSHPMRFETCGEYVCMYVCMIMLAAALGCAEISPLAGSVG
jgi:hypothetical protein